MQIDKHDVVILNTSERFGRVGEVLGVVSDSCLIRWYDNGELAMTNQCDLKNISDQLTTTERYTRLNNQFVSYFNEILELTAKLNKYKKTKFTFKELKQLMKAKKKGKLNKILGKK